MTDNTDYKKAYADLITADRVNLRERIATEVNRCGWGMEKAQEMYDWIVSDQPQLNAKRGPKPKAKKKELKVVTFGVPKKGKRRYIKRSKFWKKK